MDKKVNPSFFLVDSKVLPEVYRKVIEVKKILGQGRYSSINEAVKEAGISRSAYYKYKDSVYPFYDSSKDKIITLFFIVEDISGILSKIIGVIAKAKANIITINQNIPINGLADITISVRTKRMAIEIKDMMARIGEIKGVRRYEVLARE